MDPPPLLADLIAWYAHDGCHRPTPLPCRVPAGLWPAKPIRAVSLKAFHSRMTRNSPAFHVTAS